jgi:penicillin amidase
LDDLQQRDPKLAEQVRPLLAHLTDWDFRNSHDCTQSTLVEEWYNLMYGTLYPPEGRMTDKCAGNIDVQYRALVAAAKNVKDRHGDWKVKWGDVHRLQRHTNVADLIAVPFSDKQPSLPCAAVPGGLGSVFTQYYTPSIYIPGFRETRKHYGVLGTTYIAVFELDKGGIRGVSLTNFGSSSDPESPHYFDQAKLHSAQEFRPALYDWDDIRRQSVRSYHPGAPVSQVR